MHERQKVHSKVQIIAAVESGGSAALQFSQVGLSSSMTVITGNGAGTKPPPRFDLIRWQRIDLTRVTE